MTAISRPKISPLFQGQFRTRPDWSFVLRHPQGKVKSIRSKPTPSATAAAAATVVVATASSNSNNKLTFFQIQNPSLFRAMNVCLSVRSLAGAWKTLNRKRVIKMGLETPNSIYFRACIFSRQTKESLVFH